MALRLTAPRKAVALTGIAALGFTLAACGSSSGGSGSSGGNAASSGLDNCSFYQKTWPNISGKHIHVYTSIIAPEDKPQIDSYKPFEKCTGATVDYEGNKDFEAQLIVRVKSGNAPDIAYIPQPGLLSSLVTETGKVVAAPAQVSSNVDKWWSKDWKNYGTVNGTFYAAPLGANVKSLVWYSPKQFKSHGWQVPTTWDQMMQLTQQIAQATKGSGAKPWCAGFGSGDATGWPGTDWVEEVLLRQAGPDVYDQWVSHKISFNDSRIAQALDAVGSILKNPDYVNGGLGDVKSIATTTFQDGGQTILTGQCFLHQQASFYAANWPKGTDISPTGDVYAFYEPTMSDQFGKPVEGGGEFVTAFNNKPEVQAFQTFLSSPEWANAKAKVSSGWVSANKGLQISNLKNPIDALSAKILQDPKTVFRFDGSDAMPAAVGAGTFWKGMTDWITGKGTQPVLSDIEKSWPASGT